MSDSGTSTLSKFDALLSALPAAYERRKLGKSLTKATTSVEGALPSIALLESLAPIASELIDSFDTEGREEVEKYLGHLRKAANVAMEATSQEHLAEVDATWHNIRQSCDRIKVDFLRAFKLLQKREFGSIVPLGQILMRLAETAEIGESLSSMGKLALSMEMPHTSSQLTKWKDLLHQRDLIRQQLLEMGFSDEVQLFLNAVANDQASLSDLTPGVLAWLAERKATSAFRIRL